MDDSTIEKVKGYLLSNPEDSTVILIITDDQEEVDYVNNWIVS